MAPPDPPTRNNGYGLKPWMIAPLFLFLAGLGWIIGLLTAHGS